MDSEPEWEDEGGHDVPDMNVNGVTGVLGDVLDSDDVPVDVPKR